VNDITKARYFLTQRGSDLKHLESFALMLASAETKYREVRLRKSRQIDLPGTWDGHEADYIVDFSVLRYLKRHNQLPKNISDVFKPEITPEEKIALARTWIET